MLLYCCTGHFGYILCIDDGDFDGLLRAVERLALNDAAIEWEREQSPALGMGLRMGFLGVLHMEVRGSVWLALCYVTLRALPRVQYSYTRYHIIYCKTL